MLKPKSLVFFVLSGIFLIGGLLSGVKTDRAVFEKDAAQVVSLALKRELARIDGQAAVVLTNPDSIAAWESIHDSFFLFDSLAVLEWSTNDFLPDGRVLQDSFSVRLLQVMQGDFLLMKWPIRDRRFLLSVIPLRKDYSIVNNYLAPEWNPALFKTPLRIVAPAADGEPVLGAEGKCYFKIRWLEGESDTPLNVAGLISITLAIMLFLIGIGRLALRWHRERKYEIAFVSMAAALISLRIVMVKFSFPQAYSDFLLFDPHRFASSSFNASMADLLLNSAMVSVLCLYLFLTYPFWRAVKRLIAASAGYKLAACTTSLFLCFLALLFPYLFIEIIYHNSSISLEITDSISFDSIRWVALVSLLLGCASSFLFIHVFFRITLLLTRGNPRRFWIAFFFAALAFTTYFLATQKDYWITLEVGVAYFALLYVGKIVPQFKGFTFRTFLYFLVLTIALAFQGARSLERFNEERRIRDQFRFGNKFLVDQDVLGEFLLNESERKIAQDPFVQTVFASPFLSKSSVRQKVRQYYLNTYFNRYDVQIYLYNASGEPFGPEETIDFADLIKTYQGENYKTAYPGIYFINTPTAEATKQYLVVTPIKRHKLSAGFVVLNLRLKKVIPRNVYPELLVDNRFSHYFKSKEFSYAVFSGSRVANSFGEFNYDKYFPQDLLAQPAIYQHGIPEGNYYHIAVEDQNGQSAVVTAKKYPLFFVITNFSFLFVLGLMMVLIVLLISGTVTWIMGSRLDYAARIQLYVYLAFFLPLLTVSITTLSLTNRSAEVQLRTEYEERAMTLGEKLSAPLDEFVRDPDHYHGESRIAELAELADLDASVYDADGELIVSSQPLIFENQLLSTRVNRRAWYAIMEDKETSFIANERIGKLRYNCSYVAIKSSQSGNPIGILSVPFFGSAQSLEKIQINVLANIVTVFVLVFILFSILSFLVANGLTFPLRFIAKSIKKTTLTDKNQIIRWNSNDEIGLLASEYNRMIKNLEQSRNELARVQKETAWREIAKQVAHEIKNPLTPMKLTLQQMEKAIANEDLSPEKSKKAVETLLTQVEILNEIATSFSTFARMPAPVLERIDLYALLKNIVGLHQTYPEGTVTLRMASAPLYVLGNEQLLSRVFGNIILNALQSGSEGKKVAVVVSAQADDQRCLVRFDDDGQGIDREIQDKVFLPHFSTKKTGSGLGLAIAKQGIEQTGGRIWFETHPGKGTTFFIELVRAS